MDDEETPEEIKLTLKSLNKQFQEFKEEVFKRLPPQPLTPIHGFAHHVNPEDVAVPNEPASESIIFHFADRFMEPRTFSKKDNGTEWRELAQLFHNNNVDKIKKREDI